jgi:hypothetical protein
LNGTDCNVADAVGGYNGQKFTITFIQDAVGGHFPAFSTFYRGLEGKDVDGSANLATSYCFQIRDDGKAQLEGYLVGFIP